MAEEKEEKIDESVVPSGIFGGLAPLFVGGFIIADAESGASEESVESGDAVEDDGHENESEV